MPDQEADKECITRNSYDRYGELDLRLRYVFLTIQTKVPVAILRRPL